MDPALGGGFPDRAVLPWRDREQTWECAMLVVLVSGVAGVLARRSSAHELTRGLTLVGYDVTGTAGTFLLYGMVIVALILAGPGLLAAGARRSSRPGHREQVRGDTRHGRGPRMPANAERGPSPGGPVHRSV
ncbi:hypothetical protein GCM10010272_46800 [Streptomyces lateritius]|nr:hypothetical protein GCM10010272_46800 [Streptomyces lateritius]